MAEKGKDLEEGEEGAEVAPPATGGKKKRYLIIGGIVFLVLAAGVPAAIFAFKSKAPTNEELPADAAQPESQAASTTTPYEEELAEGEEALGAIIPFDTFIVNLSGGRYIRLQAQVEFNTLDVPRKFYTRLVPIKDQIISALTQKTADELITVKGKDSLRLQIKDTINETLRKEEVKRVYFTQFVIQ